ncbi:MAG: hypothetical protein ACRC0J_12120, partial [Shewanella oncorhynchi]
MPLTDPVPSSSFDVLERNVQDTDKFVNQEVGTFTNRVGKVIKPIPVIEAEALEIVRSIGWNPVGEFATGFTYTKLNDVGRDASGSWWRYNGSDLPKVITAGTVPSSPNFSVISFETASNIEWESGKSVGYSLDDQEGFKQALLLEAGKVDSGIPDTASDSQRVDAILRLLANTPKNAIASGIPMDGSVRTTEINAVLSAGKDLYLPTGSVKASGLVPINSTHIIGDGTTNSIITPAAINTNVMNFNNGQADTMIKGLWFEGLGYPAATTENGIVHDGTQNCRRNGVENTRFNGFSGAALRFSAGWGQRLKNVNINSSLIGL